MDDEDTRAAHLEEDIDLDSLLPPKSVKVGEYKKPPLDRDSTWKKTRDKVIARKKAMVRKDKDKDKHGKKKFKMPKFGAANKEQPDYTVYMLGGLGAIAAFMLLKN